MFGSRRMTLIVVSITLISIVIVATVAVGTFFIYAQNQTKYSAKWIGKSVVPPVNTTAAGIKIQSGNTTTQITSKNNTDDVNYSVSKYSNSTVPSSSTSVSKYSNSTVPSSSTSTKTTGLDTGTNATSTSDTTDTTSTSNVDSNTADTKTTSNVDTDTGDSSASDDTSSSNNEDNNDQSSSNKSKNPEDYDDLDELVNDIKNSDVDIEEISLNVFQDSGAYQGADHETQDCIDLGGKIGHNLGDQEIVNCSEDPNFYKNEISNNNNNNNDNSAD